MFEFKFKYHSSNRIGIYDNLNNNNNNNDLIDQISSIE